MYTYPVIIICLPLNLVSSSAEILVIVVFVFVVVVSVFIGSWMCQNLMEYFQRNLKYVMATLLYDGCER